MDAIVLPIIVPFVKDGLQCELSSFFLLALHAETGHVNIYGDWNKSRHILPWAAEVV